MFDEYLNGFPKKTQTILKKIYKVIKGVAPTASATMSYAVPTFDLLGKHFVHFAGYKNHIGFYPTPKAITQFEKKLVGYKKSKGAIQFPINKPIPYDLISEICLYRSREIFKEKL